MCSPITTTSRWQYRCSWPCLCTSITPRSRMTQWPTEPPRRSTSSFNNVTNSSSARLRCALSTLPRSRTCPVASLPSPRIRTTQALSGSLWKEFFEWNIQTENFSRISSFAIRKITGMVGWQNAECKKQKHDCKNKKHAFRSSQLQHNEAPALELDGSVLIGEHDSDTTEGKYKDLDDGRYEKTIYVKTWVGRTITAKISPDRTTGIVKMQIEARTGISADNCQLEARGRVLMDNMPLKEYGLSGGETIEMTAKRLGGVKHKSLSPKPMDTEREKQRKESEPCVDVGGLDDESPQVNPDEEPADTKKVDGWYNKRLERKIRWSVWSWDISVQYAMGNGRSQREFD